MRLSKSDFKIARSCPTKLFYKKHRYPSVKDESPYLKLLAEGGFMIEKMAKLLFPSAVDLPVTNDHENAAKTSVALISNHDEITVFEATFVTNEFLARLDILQRSGNRLELMEVKAKAYDSAENEAAIAAGCRNLFWTRRGTMRPDWQEYLEDVAFQVFVVREVFPEFKIQPFLIMPDRSKTTSIDRLHQQLRLERIPDAGSQFDRIVVRFCGDIGELLKNHFLVRVSVEAEVNELLPLVRKEASQFARSLRPQIVKIPSQVSVKCKTCEFRNSESDTHDGFGECWSKLPQNEHSILDLYHVGNIGRRQNLLANALFKQGKTSLFEIPLDHLVKRDGTVGERNKRQRIQIECTKACREWIGEDLGKIIRGYKYPLHFIDFETTALAVPYHAGMHPYDQVAFQWSCHTLPAPDATPIHSEWINVTDTFPNFTFAQSLMECVGDEGTVFMWATHENTILRRILEQMDARQVNNPDLHNRLSRLVRQKGQNFTRLIDMNQLATRHYFHPLMKGQTSVKKVCDAIWQQSEQARSLFQNTFARFMGDFSARMKRCRRSTSLANQLSLRRGPEQCARTKR